MHLEDKPSAEVSAGLLTDRDAVVMLKTACIIVVLWEPPGMLKGYLTTGNVLV